MDLVCWQLAPVCHTVGGSWVVFWDGFFSLAGMGIGVTIHNAGCSLVRVSVPVLAADATCTDVSWPLLTYPFAIRSNVSYSPGLSYSMNEQPRAHQICVYVDAYAFSQQFVTTGTVVAYGP